jgi:putative tricarboxylic transport membrane protein
MISFQNDWTVFFTRPISGTLMALVILTLLLPFYEHLRGRRATTRDQARS